MQKLEGHEREVNSVALSQDGQLVVSRSWDKTVRVWKATTGEQVTSFQCATFVREVSFSEVGQYLLTDTAQFSLGPYVSSAPTIRQQESYNVLLDS